jgi:uncharacterized repeat protein (TIGR03803 family)
MRCKRLPSRLSRFLALVVAVALISLAAAAQTKFKVLYNFKGGMDGGPIDGTLGIDRNGNLYGTAAGGPHSYWCDGTCGKVYELRPSASGEWKEMVLHYFRYSKIDGYWPFGGVILDQAGNLYGTALGGGTHNDGVVYQLKPGFGGWAETILYNFGSRKNDAGSPSGGLLNKNGNLYGLGVYPFELSPGSDGHWRERVLYRFQCGGGDGCAPVGSLIADPKGNRDGVTEFGGI